MWREAVSECDVATCVVLFALVDFRGGILDEKILPCPYQWWLYCLLKFGCLVVVIQHVGVCLCYVGLLVGARELLVPLVLFALR